MTMQDNVLSPIKEIIKNFFTNIVVTCVKQKNYKLEVDMLAYNNNVQYYYRNKINDLIDINNFLIIENKKIRDKAISKLIFKNENYFNQLKYSKNKVEDLLFKIQSNIDAAYKIYKKRGYKWKM